MLRFTDRYRYRYKHIFSLSHAQAHTCTQRHRRANFPTHTRSHAHTHTYMNTCENIETRTKIQIHLIIVTLYPWSTPLYTQVENGGMKKTVLTVYTKLT